MSFREKSAWITLVAIVLVSLLFVLRLPPPWSLAPPPSMFNVHVLLLSVTAFVVIEIVAHVVVTLGAPRDAKAPLDERDRLIALKARSFSYYAFAFLGLGSAFLIHVGANQVGLAYCILVSFVISQAVNCGARIVYYRRGA
jgi:hypothetical protein